MSTCLPGASHGPVLDDRVQPNPAKLFDMMDGFAPITNLLGIGDPDVHRIGDRWWMFFGGFHTGMRNNLFCASLPPGAPLSSNRWVITTTEDNPRRAAALVAQPPKDSWDGYGLHTPSYASGISSNAAGETYQCERIYYTGRISRSIIDNDRPVAIGVMERTSRGWVRRPKPVLQGTPEYPSVLEPKARYFEGMWRIWYAATPKVAGKKTPPAYQIRYVESEDGVTNWSEPQVLFSTDDGYFDSVVSQGDSGYEMVVCRSGNLAGKADFPAQGLWWLRSRTPSGDRDDWSPQLVQFLDADCGAEDWYANGVLGPSVQYGDTPEDRNTMFVFFTGVNRQTNWPGATMKKLAAFEKPPFPAPFYLSIGRAQCRYADAQAA